MRYVFIFNNYFSTCNIRNKIIRLNVDPCCVMVFVVRLRFFAKW